MSNFRDIEVIYNRVSCTSTKSNKRKSFFVFLFFDVLRWRAKKKKSKDINEKKKRGKILV